MQCGLGGYPDSQHAEPEPQQHLQTEPPRQRVRQPLSDIVAQLEAQLSIHQAELDAELDRGVRAHTHIDLMLLLWAVAGAVERVGGVRVWDGAAIREDPGAAAAYAPPSCSVDRMLATLDQRANSIFLRVHHHSNDSWQADDAAAATVGGPASSDRSDAAPRGSGTGGSVVIRVTGSGGDPSGGVNSSESEPLVQPSDRQLHQQQQRRQGVQHLLAPAGRAAGGSPSPQPSNLLPGAVGASASEFLKRWVGFFFGSVWRTIFGVLWGVGGGSRTTNALVFKSLAPAHQHSLGTTASWPCSTTPAPRTSSLPGGGLGCTGSR